MYNMCICMYRSEIVSMLLGRYLVIRTWTLRQAGRIEVYLASGQVYLAAQGTYYLVTCQCSFFLDLYWFFATDIEYTAQ